MENIGFASFGEDASTIEHARRMLNFLTYDLGKTLFV